MSNDAGEHTKSSAGGGGTGGGGGGGPRKESIMELAKMMDSTVRVKVTGGREFVGTLKGYDDLVNLVLDEGIEYVRDPETQLATDVSRKLGLLVIRGTQVSVISPQDGMEEISNPFAVEEAPVNAAEEEVPTVVTEE